MRQLRELPDQQSAVALCDALFASGIDIKLMASQRETFSIWVVDEAQLARAQELTSLWLDGDGADAYKAAVDKGRTTRELAMRIEERRMRQRQVVAERMAQRVRPRHTPLSWGLIALCIAVHLAVWLLAEGSDESTAIAALTILDPRLPVGTHEVSLLGLHFPWTELPRDQPWRLVTPMLLHFNILHIIFNLLWLRDLGRIIEAVHGTLYLAGFVLLSAALSNVLQLEITQSPLFGGMSGVVYGLLGLTWARGKLEPEVGYALPKSTAQLMMIWLVLGFFPNFGIANWCHLGGLVVGLCWAFLAHKLTRGARR